MANRKAEHLTFTIKVTVTIHLFAMMESQEICLKFSFATGLSIQAQGL